MVTPQPGGDADYERQRDNRIVELEDEIGADVDGICTGMHADVAEASAEVERLRRLCDEYRDELSAIADFDEWELCSLQSVGPVRVLITDVRPHAAMERDRYRLAWLSARRRASHESVMAQDAVDHIRAERDRWRALYQRLSAELESRKTFCATRLDETS